MPFSAINPKKDLTEATLRAVVAFRYPLRSLRSVMYRFRVSMSTRFQSKGALLAPGPPPFRSRNSENWDRSLRYASQVFWENPFSSRRCCRKEEIVRSINSYPFAEA